MRDHSYVVDDHRVPTYPWVAQTACFAPVPCFLAKGTLIYSRQVAITGLFLFSRYHNMSVRKFVSNWLTSDDSFEVGERVLLLVISSSRSLSCNIVAYRIT